MPGIDPALLQHLSAPAYPGSPPNPGNAAGPGAPAKEPPAAEPVALHECCKTAMDAIDAAREAVEELQQQAELAADIDPKAEKAIGDAADQLAKIDDSFDDIEKVLSGQREEHEDLVAGDDGGGGPPPG